MNINVTYINHSGFLIEWDSCYFLFDYYNGRIPSLDKDKMLVVFVSHGHGDHFNPEIFKLYKEHPKTIYLISSDIKLNDKENQKYSITEEISNSIEIIKPNQKYEIFDQNNSRILIETLKSTDLGVAFLISYNDKAIYHAGDLNLWVWLGENKQFNNNMRAMFEKEIVKLKNKTIDLAFVPLDPRQEEWYGLGMDALLDAADVKYVYPMHFWDKPEIIKRYKDKMKEDKSFPKIMDISKQEQSWRLEI